ncbi:hypothetical protein INR49_008285 [Caranx melampygus]|nr:hypothetical protein INR49_008285 [Caranx melampygus]
MVQDKELEKGEEKEDGGREKGLREVKPSKVQISAVDNNKTPLRQKNTHRLRTMPHVWSDHHNSDLTPWSLGEVKAKELRGLDDCCLAETHG